MIVDLRDVIYQETGEQGAIILSYVLRDFHSKNAASPLWRFGGRP